MKIQRAVDFLLHDGSNSRKLQLFRIFSKRKQPLNGKNSCVFVDLDGTLWEDRGPGSIFSAKRGNFFDDFESKNFNDFFNFVIGISNQTFFARKTKISFFQIIKFKCSLLRISQIFKLNDIFICFHHPNALNLSLRKVCNNRKPNTNLLLTAIISNDIDVNNSIFIGDRITDMIAARRVGILNCFLLINNQSFELNEGTQIYEYEKAFQFRVISSFRDITTKEMILG